MGPQAVLDGDRKISPLPRFDSRTVHCVASRYIEYAIPVPARVMLHMTEWHKTLLHTAAGWGFGVTESCGVYGCNFCH